LNGRSGYAVGAEGILLWYLLTGGSSVLVTPLADSPLVPSISVLTGFDTGKIQVAGTLTHPVLNVFDISQETATVPSGLLDNVNLYVAPGAARAGLTSLVNQAIAASDSRNPAPAIALLARFIVSAIDLRLRSVLNNAQATTLITLAVAGAQAVTGPVTNLSSSGLIHGAVAPESIASLHGEVLAGSRMQVDIFDSTGMHRSARLFANSFRPDRLPRPTGNSRG